VRHLGKIFALFSRSQQLNLAINDTALLVGSGVFQARAARDFFKDFDRCWQSKSHQFARTQGHDSRLEVLGL
jgi:hypothetical protein